MWSCWARPEMRRVFLGLRGLRFDCFMLAPCNLRQILSQVRPTDPLTSLNGDWRSPADQSTCRPAPVGRRCSNFCSDLRASWSINIRHLQTHRAQPFPHRAGKTLHQLVTEIVISLAFVSQAARVDPKHPNEIRRARIECPQI